MRWYNIRQDKQANITQYKTRQHNTTQYNIKQVKTMQYKTIKTMQSYIRLDITSQDKTT